MLATRNGLTLIFARPIIRRQCEFVPERQSQWIAQSQPGNRGDVELKFQPAQVRTADSSGRPCSHWARERGLACRPGRKNRGKRARRGFVLSFGENVVEAPATYSRNHDFAARALRGSVRQTRPWPLYAPWNFAHFSKRVRCAPALRSVGRGRRWEFRFVSNTEIDTS